MKKTSIVLGGGFDPYMNLALEELLLQNVEDDEVMLYLWQNQRTVVIGRNQNAWKECHLEMLERDGGKLARRLSGGGAVYHDLGNLNFTFLVPKADYDLHRQLGVILSAARTIGIDAVFSGRNDILANGRKFSGNAFYHGKRASYHHGTILVDVDMGVMQHYLNVPKQKMASKGVDSVKSRVINLKEIVPSLTIEGFKDAMQRSFIREYGGKGDGLDTKKFFNSADFMPLHEKYQSWEWRIGKSPDFDISYQTRFPWGGVQLGLMVQGGFVKKSKIYSDAMDADLVERMAECLVGVPYSRASMAKALSGLADEAHEAADVAAWVGKV